MLPRKHQLASSDTKIAAAARETFPIFAAAVIFSFFINLLMFVSPLYMLQIYDRVLGSRSITTLVALTALAGFLLIVYSALEGLRSRILVRAGLIFDKNVADPVFAAIHRGNILAPNVSHQQCLRDIDTLREFLTGSGLITLCDLPWFPIFIVASFVLHPVYGVIALIGAAITLALTVLNEISTKKHLDGATVANARAMQSAGAVFRNKEVLQAMAMVAPLKKAWLAEHGKVLDAQALASDRGGAIVAFTKFFRMFLQTIILGAGAYLVIQNEVSSGAIIAGSILIGRALQPIEMAVANWKGFIAARGAYERIKALFRAVGDEPERMRLPPPQGALAVQDLIASPPANQQLLILKGVSFAAAPGEVLGMVGPSGAGKSTLVRILVGVWPTYKGSVRIDGNDLTHWDPEQLGRYVGYLPQDVELFSGSIADNISRFDKSDPAMVIRAANLAGCHQLIQGLPEGYNTQIGEGGQALSGGQRQRVALARALYGAPRLIILDEPNASLDADGEAALLNAIREAKALGSTVIIVTHKANVLTAADKILVINGGVVQAFGPRDAILRPQQASSEEADGPRARPASA